MYLVKEIKRPLAPFAELGWLKSLGRPLFPLLHNFYKYPKYKI